MICPCRFIILIVIFYFLNTNNGLSQNNNKSASYRFEVGLLYHNGDVSNLTKYQKTTVFHNYTPFGIIFRNCIKFKKGRNIYIDLFGNQTPGYIVRDTTGSNYVALKYYNFNASLAALIPFSKKSSSPMSKIGLTLNGGLTGLVGRTSSFDGSEKGYWNKSHIIGPSLSGGIYIRLWMFRLFGDYNATIVFKSANNQTKIKNSYGGLKFGLLYVHNKKK